MTNAQWTRYVDFIAVQGALSQSDCCNGQDTFAWLSSWRDYVKFGGDRPPVKPPTP